MLAEIVGFATAKSSSAPSEWEDAACFDERWRPGCARVAVADGATEAFDAVRWVGQLTESLVAPANGRGSQSGPEIELGPMATWLAHMQRNWADQSPQEFATYIEAEKFRLEGSYATLLGWEVAGLDGPGPATWRAVAVGDTVLFQVRQATLERQFPTLGAGDFGNQPDLVHTDPCRLDRSIDSMAFDAGDVEVGDLFLVATDALAQWIITTSASNPAKLWSLLTVIDEGGFLDLVREQRMSGDLKDDDVTLVRVRVVATPSPLVVMVR